METLSIYLKYLEHFSITTIGESKIPNFSWKKCQTEKLTDEKFSEQFNHQQDKHYVNSKGDQKVLSATKGVGIVTGFEDLEVIDVDLKVFSTTTEKTSFWNELIDLLRDSIFDFDEKFVIYKTKNAGYHILYKTKRVEGNNKIAKIKGHKEAVIETRGVGGYVFIYHNNNINNNTYFDIQYITDEDRESIMRVCKSYNYVEPVSDVVTLPVKKQYASTGLKPWDDFNQQTDVWTVVNDDFTIVRDTPKKTFIKRHGATSPHSGYIYKQDNLMYLFSTGTNYPAEEQVSPYKAYVFKYHNGDYSAGAKDLYNQGFGDRAEIELPVVDFEENYNINKDDLIFPIEIFPENYQRYILECADKLDLVVDYMSSALLWITSICIGNRYKVKVKVGWYEYPVLWLALVGKAGIGKTPSTGRIMYPLEKKNERMVKDYIKKNKEFREYDELSKKEKSQVKEVLKPEKKQFIANDITLEALVQLHENVPTGVGVFKDELAGWFKDMNKYREGSDLEFWLSSWSGKSTSLVRVTRDDTFVSKPFIPVIGGIQPIIFQSLYTEEKKENGFMDRMLLCYPDTDVPEKYNENELSYDLMQWYNNSVSNLFSSLKEREVIKDDEVTSIEVSFSDEAKKTWRSKFEEISRLQNSDEENEYLKSMYPKQKSYIPRFAFILHVLNWSEDKNIPITVISEKAMIDACLLSDYFVAMAKKIKIDNYETKKLIKDVKNGDSDFDKVKKAYELDPNFNRSKMAEILNISRRTVQNYIKEIQKQNK